MKNASRVAREIGAWFHRNGLPFFFRENRDPYTVWILEVMGQQTQLSRALAYLERWLKRFPDIRTLAAAEEQQVLKMWEGLGYYSRARNIHRAARIIEERFGGVFPQTCDEIHTLPGVGEYTAAAVASTVFGEAVPAVDANVRRVFARLLLYEENASSPAFAALVKREMTGMFAAVAPGVLNEGLMEFGERVCRRRNPECGSCPLAGCCAAFREGAAGRIPVSPKRAERIEQEWAVFYLRDCRGRVLLAPPEDRGVWPGLWTLPRLLLGENPSLPALEELFESRYGIEIRADELLEPVRHSYTRYRLLFYPVSGRIQDGCETETDLQTVAQEEMEQLPFPSGMLKVLRSSGFFQAD